ncbi:Clavaminate synthase-like protein, partial [Saccharata proteae CBS 121410]
MSHPTRTPPILDFSPLYTTPTNPTAKQDLVAAVRACCLTNGFFQITGHTVPASLLSAVMACNSDFFNLAPADKMAVGKHKNSYNRGYEPPASQILEPGTLPDLKEGFYIGADLAPTHPHVLASKLNSGPNTWPQRLPTLPVNQFRDTCMAYYDAVVRLAEDVLGVLALGLGLDEGWFGGVGYAGREAVATMRLLHYPAQEGGGGGDGDGMEGLRRGIGAHTDFGGVTVLLQGEVGGLQVWDREVGGWFDVPPTPNAFVINLGNLMQRWSNDRYISNTHRVINPDGGRERHSIALFYSGNPDYVVECLPNCRDEGEMPKYPPITVQEAILGGYRSSYGAAERFKREGKGE